MKLVQRKRKFVYRITNKIMTAQRTDTIIVNGKEHKLYCLPLNQYWEKYERTILCLVVVQDYTVGTTQAGL